MTVETQDSPLETSASARGTVPMNEEILDQGPDATYRLHRRFDRMGRLVGDSAMEKLFKSHVMIIGLGGVGSWAAESIARSGVGKITLVDFDEICITNFNRQLHATQGLVGQQKTLVMAERLKKINPQATIVPIVNFYNARLASEIFGTDPSAYPDIVIDAIDSITSKCHLINFCVTENIKIISAQGSGGRLDPSRIKIDDLSVSSQDPLAKSVRKILRDQYGFPESSSYGVRAVFSTEPAQKPQELKYDNGKGFRCVCPQGQNEFFNCDNRNLILGNSSFVTGSFGLFCASEAVKIITQE